MRWTMPGSSGQTQNASPSTVSLDDSTMDKGSVVTTSTFVGYGETSKEDRSAVLKPFKLKYKDGAVVGKDRKIEKAVIESVIKKDNILQQTLFHDRSILAKNFDFEGHPNCTLLHVTSFYGDLAGTKAILSSFSNVNKRSRDGLTPLHFAVGNGHKEVTALLLERGADVHAVGAPDGVPGSQPLHVAVARGQVAIAKLLLDAGAEVDAIDAQGSTPLHFAAEYGGAEMVQLLLYHDADLNARTRQSGKTPLHLGAGGGKLNVVKCLLDAGADPNSRSGGGYTPLDGAFNRCEWEVVKYLGQLSSGSKFLEEDKTGRVQELFRLNGIKLKGEQ